MSIFKVKGGAFLSRTEPQNAQYFNNTFADASICLVVMSDIIVWLIVRLHISLNLFLWNSGFPTMCSHRFWMKVSLTSLSLSTTDENLNPRSKVLTFYSIMNVADSRLSDFWGWFLIATKLTNWFNGLLTDMNSTRRSGSISLHNIVLPERTDPP